MLTINDVLLIALANVIASTVLTCLRLIAMGHVKVIHISPKDFEEEEDE